MKRKIMKIIEKSKKIFKHYTIKKFLEKNKEYWKNYYKLHRENAEPGTVASLKTVLHNFCIGNPFILSCRVILAQLSLGICAVHVSLGKIRVEINSLRIIIHGISVSVQCKVYSGPVQICKHVIWIHSNYPVIIVYGIVIISYLRSDYSSIVKCQRVARLLQQNFI